MWDIKIYVSKIESFEVHIGIEKDMVLDLTLLIYRGKQ